MWTSLGSLVFSLLLLTVSYTAACSRRRHDLRRPHPHWEPHWTPRTTVPDGDCPCVPLGACAAVVRALNSPQEDFLTSLTGRIPRRIGGEDCMPLPGREDVPRVRCCLLESFPSTETSRRPTPPVTPPTRHVTPPQGSKPDPECGVCGLSPLDQRIVGGKEATLGQFPWIARLGYYRGSDNVPVEAANFQCGGSLVSRWHVVTAAHCVQRPASSPQLRWVRLGEHDERTPVDCDDNNECAPPTQDLRVAAWRSHPDYQVKNGFQHDLAVLRLEAPVNFSDWVRPICLPPPEVNATSGQRVVVAGWGTTIPGATTGNPVLMTLWKSIVDPEECLRRYKGSAVITSGHVCAGGSPGEDSCSGDSGGPLAYPVPTFGHRDLGEPRFALLGVVSFGARLCGSNGMPGVYTNVQHYMDWVKGAIRELEPPPL